MDDQKYLQARMNVLKEHEEKIQEEIKEEIKRLKNEDEKLIVSEELKKEILALEKKIWSFPCRRMWEDRYLGRMCAELREMAETGRYHPKDLERLKEFAVKREASERERKNEKH